MRIALLLLAALMFVVGCGCGHDPMDDPQYVEVGPLWVRSIYYNKVTIETEANYISTWDMCNPSLVWQGFHGRISFSKRRGYDGCWEATVVHMPPDVH